MNITNFIGHLGADAEIVSIDGNEFISFRIASTRRWKDSKGNDHEDTQWCACTMSSDRKELVPYLKKGQKVFVAGPADVEMYSSPKLRRMVARLRLRVRDLEFCGGGDGPQKLELADENGQLVEAQKISFWYIPGETYQFAEGSVFTHSSGAQYTVDKAGYLTPLQQDDPQTSSES